MLSFPEMAALFIKTDIFAVFLPHSMPIILIYKATIRKNRHVSFNEPIPSFRHCSHAPQGLEQRRKLNEKDFSPFSVSPFHAGLLG
jgi:hypothetical protein